MKTKKVLFKDLSEGALFIEGKLLPNYHVFEKTGSATARVYGSNTLMTFEKTHDIITVTESSFGELPVGSQFAAVVDAKAPAGIIAPLEILSKDSRRTAIYVDLSQNSFPIQIDDDERVINLNHIFNFKNVTTATLNI